MNTIKTPNLKITLTAMAGHSHGEIEFIPNRAGDIEIMQGDRLVAAIPKDRISDVVDFFRQFDDRIAIDHAGQASRLRAELVKIVGASTHEELNHVEKLIEMDIAMPADVKQKSLNTIKLLRDTAGYANR